MSDTPESPRREPGQPADLYVLHGADAPPVSEQERIADKATDRLEAAWKGRAEAAERNTGWWRLFAVAELLLIGFVVAGATGIVSLGGEIPFVGKLNFTRLGGPAAEAPAPAETAAAAEAVNEAAEVTPIEDLDMPPAEEP